MKSYQKKSRSFLRSVIITISMFACTARGGLSSMLYSIREHNLTIKPIENFLKVKQKQLNNYRKNFLCIVPPSDRRTVNKALKNNNQLEQGIIARGDGPLYNTLQKTHVLLERYKTYSDALRKVYKANFTESLEKSYSEALKKINKIKPEVDRNLALIKTFLRGRGCAK